MVDPFDVEVCGQRILGRVALEHVRDLADHLVGLAVLGHGKGRVAEPAGRGEQDLILLYVGGNLVVGKQAWEDVEARYLDMGFDRAFPNQTRVEDVIEALDKDFAQRPKAKP